MICPKCGAAAAQGEKFCKNCGSELPAEPISYAAPAAQQTPYAAPAQPQPTYTPPPVYAPPVGQPSGYSPEYKPISAWGYIGYGLLFSITCVGFIIALVFAFSNENINRRNFARSYLLGILIAIVIAVITAVIATVLGVNLSEYVPQTSLFLR